MYLQGMGSRPGSISEVVQMEAVGLLHGTLVPIMFTGLAQAIAGTIAARQTGDVVTGVLTAISVIVNLVRAFEVFAYRHRVAKKPPLDFAEAARWGRRYAVGTLFTSFGLGLFAARSLTLGDATCSMMAMGIAFGFGAGIVPRLSLLPFLALADLGMLGLPAVIAAFAWLDVPHVGLAMSIAIFTVCSFEMVRQTFNSTVNRITLKHEFEQLARIDPMTGVLNRSVLVSDLPRIVAEQKEGLVVIYAIDLDYFKAANDRFGHPVGDALLKQVAGRLTSLAGPAGLVIRMGGDEFILADPNARSRVEAEALARQIQETVSAPYCVNGHDVLIGASIGVAVSPDDGQTVEALLSRSDRALYRAKNCRGGYVFAGDLRTAKRVADTSAAQHCAA